MADVTFREGPVNIIWLFILALSIAVSCAESDFQGAGGALVKNKPKKQGITGVKGPNDQITSDEDEADNVLRLRYGSSIKPRVADYLFIMDNSVSMNDDMAQVSAGLTGIPKERFPESAKIAVMTTMAARNPSATPLATHVDIDRYACIDKEPGFLDLVNAEAVTSFTNCNNAKGREAYPMPLCDDKWFAPYDVNSSNQRCFTAAFQNPRHGVGCEPGMLALKQLFERHQGKPLFRENAAVNIIFVSDEMDGCAAADATNRGISADAMKQAITTAAFGNSKIATLKIHGIIPASVPANNLGYKPVIDLFAGYSTSVAAGAAAGNYSNLIEQVVDDKVEMTSSEFALPAGASGVIRIEIDGVATTNFQFLPTSRSVKVTGLDPAKPVEVAIRYK